MLKSILSAAALTALATADPAPCPAGQFATATQTYTDDGFQEGSNVTSRNFIVHYPNVTSGDKFPLIAYAHGAAGGGPALLAYNEHFAQVASYGFVVIAPDSCFMGCAGGALGGGWKTFQFENTRAMDFSKDTAEAWGKIIDWDAGVGIAGHSMGAAALVMNSVPETAAKYNIKATVVEHGYAVGTKPEMKQNSVPTLVMTSTTDVEVPPYDSKPIYANDETFPKAWRNQKGLGHLEPLTTPNPYLAYHTAAWFKIFINGDTGDFKDAIYGSGEHSLCTYDAMEACEVLDK